jgi:hypothetical protein
VADYYLKNNGRQPKAGVIPLDPPVHYLLGPRGTADAQRPLTAEEAQAMGQLPLAKLGLEVCRAPDAQLPTPAPSSVPRDTRSGRVKAEPKE